MKQIDVTTASSRLADGAVMIDVREQHEWDAGHAIGAIHIPAGQVVTTPLEADSAYLMMCRSGARSGMTTGALAQQGLDVVNVEGGMIAWSAAGLPMESANGQAPRIISP